MRTEPAMPRCDELRTHSETAARRWARCRRALAEDAAIASWMPPRICPPAPLVTSTMTIAQTSSRAPRYSADVWPRGSGRGSGIAQRGRMPARCTGDQSPGSCLGPRTGPGLSGTAGAAPDVDHLAHRGGAPGDPRVQRTQDQLEAAAPSCASSFTSAWKRRPFLSTSTMSPGPMPFDVVRRVGGRGGLHREQGRLGVGHRRAEATWRPGRTPRRAGAGRRCARGPCARR